MLSSPKRNYILKNWNKYLGNVSIWDSLEPSRGRSQGTWYKHFLQILFEKILDSLKIYHPQWHSYSIFTLARMERIISEYYQSDSVSEANCFGGPERQIFHTTLLLVSRSHTSLLAQLLQNLCLLKSNFIVGMVILD